MAKKFNRIFQWIANLIIHYIILAILRVAPHKPTRSMLLLARLIYRARMEAEGKLVCAPGERKNDVDYLGSRIFYVCVGANKL